MAYLRLPLATGIARVRGAQARVGNRALENTSGGIERTGERLDLLRVLVRGCRGHLLPRRVCGVDDGLQVLEERCAAVHVRELAAVAAQVVPVRTRAVHGMGRMQLGKGLDGGVEVGRRRGMLEAVLRELRRRVSHGRGIRHEVRERERRRRGSVV